MSSFCRSGVVGKRKKFRKRESDKKSKKIKKEKDDTDFDFLIESIYQDSIQLIGDKKEYMSQQSKVIAVGLEWQSAVRRPILSIKLPDESPVGFRLGQVFIQSLRGIDETPHLNDEENRNFAVLVDQYDANISYPMAVSALIRIVISTNCFEIYNWLGNFGNRFVSVKDYCLEYLRRNLRDCLKESVNWTLQLWEKVLSFEWSYNERCDVPFEIEFFINLLRWGGADSQNNMSLYSLCRLIRFPLMTRYQLERQVKNSGIISAREYEIIMDYITGRSDLGLVNNPFNCKTRQFYYVSSSRGFQNVLSSRRKNLHIRLEEGVYNGPFLYQSTTHPENVHIVGAGTEKTIIRGAVLASTTPLFQGSFRNSTISDLSFIVPNDPNTLPEMRKSVFLGNGILLQRLHFTNTRLQLSGKDCRVESCVFDGDLKENRPRLYGNFSFSKFCDLTLCNLPLGFFMSSRNLKNSFENISFFNCQRGFSFDRSDGNIVNGVNFYYPQELNISSTILIEMKGCKGNKVRSVTSIVPNPSSHTAMYLVPSVKNSGSFRDCEKNNFEEVETGEIFLTGSSNCLKNCRNIANLDVRDSSQVSVTNCSGETLTKRREDVTLEMSNCSFASVIDI